MTQYKASAHLKANQIANRLQSYMANGNRMFATSSFQTHSLPLLHIVAASRLDVDIVFLNTGYLFPETLQFRDQVSKLLNLKVIDCRPSVPKSEQRTRDGRLLFAADPDKCCYLNKIAPLEPFLRQYDVWINGVRAEQSPTRKAMHEEQSAPYDTLRYHPMLTWTSDEVDSYRKYYGLPSHPLEADGYLSIGCMPCTVKQRGGSGHRSGRWHGQAKTECGLHTHLAGSSRNTP